MTPEVYALVQQQSVFVCASARLEKHADAELRRGILAGVPHFAWISELRRMAADRDRRCQALGVRIAELEGLPVPGRDWQPGGRTGAQGARMRAAPPAAARGLYVPVTRKVSATDGTPGCLSHG